MCPVGFILFWQSKAQIQKSRCSDNYKMSVEVENISSFFRGHKTGRQAYYINLISRWKTTSTQSARPESSHFIGILILKSGLTGMPGTWSQIWLWITVTFIKSNLDFFSLFCLLIFFVFFFRSVMQLLCKIKVFTSTFGFHDLGPSFWVCRNNNPYGFSQSYFWNLVAIQILLKTKGSQEIQCPWDLQTVLQEHSMKSPELHHPLYSLYG